VRLTLRVQPADAAAPYRATVTTLVSRLAIPRAGDRVAVVYDPVRPSRVALASSSAVVSPNARDAMPARSATATIDELTRLAALRESGAITPAEYERLKQRLMAGE